MSWFVPLSTTDARREALLEASLPLFAEKGINGTPTLAVAKASEISQAYLFRLFPTKDDLAIALIEQTNATVHRTMTAAAGWARRAGKEIMLAIGQAYSELLQHDRDLLLLQLHAHAASPGSPAIRDAMREGFARLFAFVGEATGASADDLRRLFAQGMLSNVIATLDAWELDAPWAAALSAPPPTPTAPEGDPTRTSPGAPESEAAARP